MTRIAPRHAFALGGLLLVSAAAWNDRHAIALVAEIVADTRREPNVLHTGYDLLDQDALDARLEPGPQAAASLRVRAALHELEQTRAEIEAQLARTIRADPAFADARPNDGLPWEEVLKHLDATGWDTYWRARDELLPAYRAAVDDLTRAAEAAATTDPDNGAYALTAALAQSALCYRPSPLDPLSTWDQDPDASAARIEVTDPAGLQRAIDAAQDALAAERFTFHNEAVQRARLEACQTPGPAGELERLTALSTVVMPELMFSKRHGGIPLTQLARRARLQGRDSEPFLRAARLLALRQGAEGETAITQLVGLANVALADEAWLLDAATRGDTTRALAAQRELSRLQRARTQALRQDLARERLGLVDWALLPVGGWGSWSSQPGLAVDQAFLESTTLWLLILLTLAALCRCAVQARRGKPSAVAPWTFGDLLGVLLPSLGVTTALTLCLYRLHPSTQIGVGAGAIESRLFPLAFLPAVGVFTCAWLLRRRVLAKAGLDFARPRAARASLGLALASTWLALDWIGPWSMALAPLTLALAAAAVVLAWRGGVFGQRGYPRELRSALSRYEARVGTACLGAGLILVGAVQLGVSARRERLTTHLADQYVEKMLHEADHWGGGALGRTFREVLDESPQRPLSSLERQD